MRRNRSSIVAGALLLCSTLVPVPVAQAEIDRSGTVGTTFPKGFPKIIDRSLGVPVLGFGSTGRVTRTPVIFLHGNNDTSHPTDCNSAFGKIHEFAQHFHDRGYRLSELWGLSYQGDQCDAQTDPPVKSGKSHSTVVNVPDLRRFVHAVLDFTGAEQVDIIGHSLGGTLAREWMRQDQAYRSVRTLVAVDAPNKGIINCSPSSENYWQQDSLGGFTPDSAICREYGAARTPFLRSLNKNETPGSTDYMAIRNTDTSFVFFAEQDGSIPPVPAEDRKGQPHDFSKSARLEGGINVGVIDQGRYDEALQTAHLGIVNSPEVWDIALGFLLRK